MDRDEIGNPLSSLHGLDFLFSSERSYIWTNLGVTSCGALAGKDIAQWVYQVG